MPINLAHVVDHSNVLASKLTTILETVKGIASEADHDGIQFIATAIQHNLRNLQAKASEWNRYKYKFKQTIKNQHYTEKQKTKGVKNIQERKKNY